MSDLNLKYKDVVNSLLELEAMGCGGSQVAAEVLLSLYDGYSYQCNLAGLACRLDDGYLLNAVHAIQLRALTLTEPHNVIDNGQQVFDALVKRWPELHIDKRSYSEG